MITLNVTFNIVVDLQIIKYPQKWISLAKCVSEDMVVLVIIGELSKKNIFNMSDYILAAIINF